MNRNEFNSYEKLLDAIQASLHPLDWAVLAQGSPVEDIRALSKSAPLVRSDMVSFFFHVALGGIFSPSVRKAYDEGKLYRGKSLNVSSIPLRDNRMCEGIMLVDLTDQKRTALESSLKAEGSKIKLLNVSEAIWCNLGKGAPMSHQVLKDFLINIGGSVTDGMISGVSKSVPWSVGRTSKDYYLLWNGRKKIFRHYFSLGVKAKKDPILYALLGMAYILGGTNANGIRKRAMQSCLWVEDTTVGWDHAISRALTRNKVALLEVKVENLPGYPVTITQNDSLMLEVAKSYNAAGISVFMHKGAGYIAADVACAGFHLHKNGAVSVAWKADKYAKLTGRALFLTSTGLSWSESELGFGVQIEPTQETGHKNRSRKI